MRSDGKRRFTNRVQLRIFRGTYWARRGLIIKITVIHHWVISDVYATTTNYLSISIGAKLVHVLIGCAEASHRSWIWYEVVYCDVADHREKAEQAVDKEGDLGAEPSDEQAAENGAAATS